MCTCDRKSAREQKSGIEQRDFKGFGPIDSSGGSIGDLRTGVEGGMEIGPEQGEEKTNLPNNEKSYADTQTAFHTFGMFPLERSFTTDVTPPLSRW